MEKVLRGSTPSLAMPLNRLFLSILGSRKAIVSGSCASLTATDFSAKMLKRAAKHCAAFDHVTFEQADKEVTMKIRIPKWSGIDSNCVCLIDGVQHKVYNKADVISSQGYMETALTLVNPTMDYEVVTE